MTRLTFVLVLGLLASCLGEDIVTAASDHVPQVTDIVSATLEDTQRLSSPAPEQEVTVLGAGTLSDGEVTAQGSVDAGKKQLDAFIASQSPVTSTPSPLTVTTASPVPAQPEELSGGSGSSPTVPAGCLAYFVCLLLLCFFWL